MITLGPTTVSSGHGDRDRGKSRRSSRNRLIPGAESLEVRDCPSAMAAQLGFERSAHALEVKDRGAVQLRHIEASRQHAPHGKVHVKKSAKGAPGTIYVAPNGKAKATAGKTAARPMSFVLAVKRAAPGSTIYLAPGAYTQNVVINGKSNLTIIGQPDGSSVITAPGTTKAGALLVNASSNVTISNVSFRETTNGVAGLAIVASTVTVSNISTNGTSGDGVLVGQGGVLTASNSHFDQVQVGSGLELQPGSSATITNSTFNGNGTSPNATASSNGMRVDTGASANIVGSQFNGNTYAGLNAYGNGQVTVSQSTFSGNKKGDGALIQDQATATLTGNTFSSNGMTVGESTGLNGLEFIGGYSGTAVVSGNSFLNNTANGLFIGGAANTITVSGNQFQGNVVGLSLDSSSAAIHATVVGNTFIGPTDSHNDYAAILALGDALTATIGGTDTDANTIEDYTNDNYINQADGSGANVGCPKLNILTNTYLRAGQRVAPSDAIRPC